MGADDAILKTISLLSLGALVGLWYLYKGVKKYILLKKIENTATSKVHAVALGLVELCGHARCKPKMKSPIGKQPCVYWKLVAQYYQSGKHGGWREIYKKNSSEIFYLYDETGEILVDPNGAEINIKHDYLHKGYISGKGFWGMKHTKMPSYAIEYINSLNEKDKKKFIRHSKENVRIYEYFIREDIDQIYVLGTAERIKDTKNKKSHESLIVKKGTFDRLLYITDSNEEKVLEKLRSTIRWGVFGGFILFAICLSLLILVLFNH